MLVPHPPEDLDGQAVLTVLRRELVRVVVERQPGRATQELGDLVLHVRQLERGELGLAMRDLVGLGPELARGFPNLLREPGEARRSRKPGLALGVDASLLLRCRAFIHPPHGGR